MTTRDRIVLMAIVVLVLLGGGWLLVVSPERKHASEAQASVQSARSQLASAQSQAASARVAQRGYTAAYSSLVSLGKAVPPADEVPSLIYELELVSDERGVEFNSITAASSGSSSAPPAPTAAASAATSDFTLMPFTFVFKGTFVGLAHLLGEVEGFALRTTAGGLKVKGRLLTIQGVEITPEGDGSETSKGANVPLTATITATAYVLPTTEGLTGGATASGPGTAGATSASAGSGSSGSPATPAVVRAP